MVIRSFLSAAAVFCALRLVAKPQESPVVLTPFQEATVTCALDSELQDCHYKVGEPFTNGALIAELNDERYRVAFQRACDHRDFTEKVAIEQRELRKKDFASETDLRRAEYDAKIAHSEYLEASINLKRCRLVAPFAGKIAEMLTQRFEMAKPGQPLFRIIEDDRLLAVANLPLGSVAVGQAVEIVPDGALMTTGTVYEVAPQADNRTGTVRVRVLVENAGRRLSAGMTGLMREIEPEKPAEAVAVAKERDLAFAFLPTGPHYASVPEAFSGTATVTNKPTVEITGYHFERGVLGYVVCRPQGVVTIGSIKRFGEFTAGIYDGEGKRLAYIAPRQIALPPMGGAVTNLTHFAPGECLDAEAKGGELKLVMRVENDVRAQSVSFKAENDGGK